MAAALTSVLLVLLAVGFLLICRLLYCMKYPTPPLSTQSSGKTKPSFCTMVVLGSGGHTAEMLTTIKNLDFQVYKPMHYVAAKTDKHSFNRAKNSHSKNDVLSANDIHFHRIYRSREVKQSWITTVFTTLYSLLESFKLVLVDVQPDVIICNGPGTCIPILFNGLLLRVLCIKPNIKLIFLESFCRVDDLSMSGKIAYRFVNLFIVQWPQLVDKYPSAKYIGRIF